MSARLRSSIPSLAALGLNGPHASEDLQWLGWTGIESVPLLWTLSATGNQNLALMTLRRLGEKLGAEYENFNTQLHQDAAFRARIFALAGGSSALGDHLVAHPQVWQELLRSLPEEAELFQTMLSCIGATPIGAEGNRGSAKLDQPGTYRASCSPAEAKHALINNYRTLLVRIAAYDLAGTLTPTHDLGLNIEPLGYEKVTHLLSTLADAALTASLAVAISAVATDCEEDWDPGVAVIALGKCGAGELNYISDVDVIFVADEADNTSTRIVSEFIKLSSSCFFEVDANLRPEGRSGALVRTLDSHLKYYRRWAETWEFQALLKARPMTGAMNLAQEYVEQISPLVWQASLRESFVEDIQAMRRRVVDTVPEDLKARELKLGSGGLRDVEFAVQLLQLVHGRSDESLRQLSTTSALNALMDGGYIGREDGAQLIEAYETLRLFEHRLQLQKLRRTHSLPADEDTEAWSWLAAASGFKADGEHDAVENLVRRLKRLRQKISGLHAKLFYRPLLHSVVTMSVDELKLSPEAVHNQLAALGYKHPTRAVEHLKKLATGSTRKAKLQTIVLPSLMEYLSETADPDAGLLNYRKLSEAAFDRTWFLRMIRDEGIVAQRLMFILGTSPYTADLLISSPDTVKLLSDSAGGPKLLATAPDQVSTALVAASKRHHDPDTAVTRARSLRKVDLARIACADLLGLMSVEQVCEELSFLWNAVLQAAILAEVRGSLDELGLDEEPARIAVIGMGRLGGRELGYGSDADVLVVAEPVGDTPTNEAIAWSSKIVDGLRTRLSKPSSDPSLEVDLGLRPEGRSGPVVRTIESYRAYYEKWGETWEIQALLRAAYVAGDKDVASRFLHMIDQFRYPTGGATPEQVREVRRIKARVDNERLPRGADRSTHTKLGRGALTDIEWTVQLITMEWAHKIPQLHNTSTLEVLDALEELDDPEIISASQVAVLRKAWLKATKARNAIVLVRGKRKDQLPQGGIELAKVAGAAGYKVANYQEFLESYLRATRRAKTVVDEIFWGEEPTMAYSD